MFNRYRHTGVKVDTKTGIRYQKPTLYPDIPESDSDSYHIVVVGERLDLLAYKYYNDSGLWWVISRANNLDPSITTAEVGTELRIPSDIGSILSRLQAINSG
jgi:hypothetical protein